MHVCAFSSWLQKCVAVHYNTWQQYYAERKEHTTIYTHKALVWFIVEFIQVHVQFEVYFAKLDVPSKTIMVATYTQQQSVAWYSSM